MGAAAARAAAAAAGDTDALNRMRARLPASEEIWLAVDDDAVAAYRQVKSDTGIARLGRDPAAKELAEKKLAEARADLEGVGAVRFVLRNQGRRRYRQLLETPECQPRDTDHEEVRRFTGRTDQRAQWNGDEWPARLVAMCTVSPAGLSHTDLQEWVADGRLSEGEMDRLFTAAQMLHTGNRVVDLGK